MESAEPLVSVIIPVYNDADRLAICLSALDEQTYPASRYEVIVVDNGSDESIQPTVANFRQAHVAYEERPGSYAARNRGIAQAKGEILAFTDADCRPTSGWIGAGVERLQELSSGNGVVGGHIDFFFHQRGQPNVVEVVDSSLYLDQQRYCTELNFAATANMFTTRSVMKDVGSFNAETASGGDREWGERAHAYGCEVTYAERARVWHPARSSVAAYRRKMRRFAQARYAKQKRKRGRYSLPRLLGHVLLHTVRELKRVHGRVRTNENLSEAKKFYSLLVLIFLEGLVYGWEFVRTWVEDKMRL